jgi:glycosyltransferase involved in cell wall biosynthesis
MRILYVNHTGLVGGAERSLLNLFDTLPADVEAVLACPPGPLHGHATRRGIRPVSIAGSAGSLKLHVVHTPVAIGAMAAAAAGVLRTARSCHADLLHANSIRAGLIADPVARTLRRPLVVHVRDSLPPSPLTRRLQASLAGRAAAVIAISHHVARAFDPDRTARRLEVIDNPFELSRLDPARIDRDAARTRLGLAPDALALTLVAQITPWKGQEEAVRALARVRRAYPSAVLLLVGEAKFVARATRYDNRSYLRRLRLIVDELELGDAVRFLGERDEVPEILRAGDVALLPSWDEPFGRAVVEAMAIGLPVVTTSVGGPAEIVRDGVDGLLVAPRQPDALAAAILWLLDNPGRRKALGAAAREAMIKRFGASHQHAAAVSALYRKLLGDRRTASSSRGHLQPVESLD